MTEQVRKYHHFALFSNTFILAQHHQQMNLLNRIVPTEIEIRCALINFTNIDNPQYASVRILRHLGLRRRGHLRRCAISHSRWLLSHENIWRILESCVV